MNFFLKNTFLGVKNTRNPKTTFSRCPDLFNPRKTETNNSILGKIMTRSIRKIFFPIFRNFSDTLLGFSNAKNHEILPMFFKLAYLSVGKSPGKVYIQYGKVYLRAFHRVFFRPNPMKDLWDRWYFPSKTRF